MKLNHQRLAVLPEKVIKRLGQQGVKGRILFNGHKIQLFFGHGGFAQRELSKRRQSLTVNKIKEPLRWTAWSFLPLFPLLYGRLANTKDRRKNGLADMVSRPDPPDVLGLNGRLVGKQSASILRMVISSMAPILKRSRAISCAMSKISLMILYLPYRAFRQKLVNFPVVCGNKSLGGNA